MDSTLIVAACLSLLGVAHSVLGEREILQPLFRSAWAEPSPRWAMERILRFAWHMTSLAWFALAAIALGANTNVSIAVMSLGSAAVVFVILRGHLSWPLFLLAGLAALRSDGALTNDAFEIAGLATAGMLVGAALLHLYWVAGGTWMLDLAVPTGDGVSFSPGRLLTAAVAAALLVFAVLVATTSTGDASGLRQWLTGAGVGVLTLRAIGDGRIAGFTKTDRSTAFAEADDRWFTPFVVVLALGGAAALLA